MTTYDSKVLSKIIIDIHPNISTFSCGTTYESINLPPEYSKPTIELINSKVSQYTNIIAFEKLRTERDLLLNNTDKYTSIPDWPHANDTVKQAWLTYRQALRDLPSTASPQLDSNGELTNVTWPTPPS